jgi:hypothetical protein
VVNLRPEEQAPETDYVPVDHSRIIRVIRRIAHDLEELARARRVQDLSTSANDADPCLGLRRRLAEPPIKLSVGAMSIQQSRQAWEDYANDLKEGRTARPTESLSASRLFSKVNALSGFSVQLLPRPQ